METEYRYPDDYQVNIDEWPVDDQGRHIVPDEIMQRFYRQLPTGTLNETGNYIAYNGGKLYRLGRDKERDAEVNRAGADATNAKRAQRRSFAEDIRDILSRNADPAILQAAGIAKGTYQDAIIAAQLREASKGNVRAVEFLRDTAGEAPVKQQEITATVTEGDKELLRKVQQRLGIEG